MFDWLKQKLNDIVQWFSDALVATFEAMWDALTDLFAFAFEALLDLVIIAVEFAMDCCGVTGDLSQYSETWGSLPAEIVNVLGLLGIGECFGILICAWSVRMLLQLIPFVRFGS